jgi:hypothetical protein
MVFAGAAVAALLAFAVIEPATTRAAFGVPNDVPERGAGQDANDKGLT